MGNKVENNLSLQNGMRIISFTNKETNFGLDNENKDDNNITNRNRRRHHSIRQPISNQKYIIKQREKKERNKRICFLIIFSLSIVFIIALIVIIHSLFKKRNKEYGIEKLVAKINYKPNIIFKFRSEKIINMTVDIDETENDDNTRQITQYIDFLFIIREEQNEIDLSNSFIKHVYSGYLSIFNVTINNQTNDMTLIYDEKINKFIGNSKNLKNMEEETNLDYVGENNKFCFAKIEFYENGEIKNIYIPEKFNIQNIIYINNLIKLLIPKLSPKLYSKNIDNEIQKLDNLNDLNNSENENEIDYFNEIEEENKDNEKNNINNRILDNEFDNNSNISLNHEEYISTSTYDSTNINLREIKNFSDTDNDNDYINLTQYSVNNIESEQANFEDSELNTIIYTTIDAEGNLFSIKEIQNAIMSQNNIQENNINEHNNDNLINNDNNIFSEADTIFEENDTSSNNFSFNLSSISIESINTILLSDHFNDEEFNKELFNYFDSFEYKIYNEKENNQEFLRFLNTKEYISENKNLTDNEIEFISSKELLLLKEKKFRALSNNNAFRGINALYDKNLYNQNLLGLKMEGKTFCEIDYSTGIINNYLITSFGNINTKFDFGNQYTNMHIALENTNQMIFKFISLLNKSNKDLIERNKYYSNIIIELEKNTSMLFEDIYDFSGVFRFCLKDMYKQVQKFTGEFFNELIE